LRTGANEPLEEVAEDRRGAEPDLEGDSLDGMPHGFEQVLRLADPSTVVPPQRGRAGLLAEAAVQGAVLVVARVAI